jgi:hypothetical protein
LTSQAPIRRGEAAPNGVGAPEISDATLRAATVAVRAALIEYAGVDNWGVAEIVAKAALASSPEITPEMIEAGVRATVPFEALFDDPREGVTRIYQAMRTVTASHPG